MDSMFYRARIAIKVFFTFIFYFPGLVLHEGSHAIVALATLSKITKIKLFPSIEFNKHDSGYTVVYGYVESIAAYRVSNVAIGLAPFLLWLIPIYVMNHNGWINLDTYNINWSGLFQLKNYWFILLLTQIAWAGFPSSQDWKVFFYGLFSISALFFFALVYFAIVFVLPKL